MELTLGHRPASMLVATRIQLSTRLRDDVGLDQAIDTPVGKRTLLAGRTGPPLPAPRLKSLPKLSILTLG